MEQVIGVGACVIGDMSARPNWGEHTCGLWWGRGGAGVCIVPVGTTGLLETE